MDPYKLIEAHQNRPSQHEPSYVYESVRKNIVIRPLNGLSHNVSQSSLNDSTLNIAASQMVRLNLADVNVTQLPESA